jgi:hypothetical protein
MTDWLAEHVVAHGAPGILAAVLLLPVPAAPLPTTARPAPPLRRTPSREAREDRHRASGDR